MPAFLGKNCNETRSYSKFKLRFLNKSFSNPSRDRAAVTSLQIGGCCLVIVLSRMRSSWLHMTLPMMATGGTIMHNNDLDIAPRVAYSQGLASLPAEMGLILTHVIRSSR